MFHFLYWWWLQGVTCDKSLHSAFLFCSYMCMKFQLLLLSHFTLCNPKDGSPPGYSVLGILQARILEWAAISFSKGCMRAKSLQSCLTLHDSRDSNPPGSSVQGILQARILEWVATSFSRNFS